MLCRLGMVQTEANGHADTQTYANTNEPITLACSCFFPLGRLALGTQAGDGLSGSKARRGGGDLGSACSDRNAQPDRIHHQESFAIHEISRLGPMGLRLGANIGPKIRLQMQEQG